ncbi:response regulator [Thalassolituus sp.]|uniref:response regulator n=1 Tax=Thalassolituus sp. TaxID=2030822 RepID=UPI003516C5DA
MTDATVNLQGQKILIVDDLVEARSALKSMLTVLGADDIYTATDGREAVEFIMEHDFDMVLSDYNLGKGKDGQQILEEARYTNRLRATATFVMITGENAVDRVMGALEYDPDAYITKPFTLSILRERLYRLRMLKNILQPVNKAIDLGEIDWAIELADQVMTEHPRLLLPVSRLQGKLCMRQERYEDALEAYTRVLETRPASWARLGQAVCFHFLGDTEQALTLIRATLLDHPLYVQCHDWLAKILMGLGENIEAQKELEAAVQISPRAVLRQLDLGQLALSNESFEVAQDAFEQAMRLARYSCYKSSDTYKQFVEAAQHNLGAEQSKENRLLCSKALRALDEMKQEFSGNMGVIFDATIAESKTYQAVEDDSKARSSADKAEGVLARIKEPTDEQQLTMTEVYIDTGQSDKAATMVQTIKDHGVTGDLLQRLGAIEHRLSNINAREKSAELNELGVAHYEKGELRDAIAAFDQATRYDEAGISVLLNAIQAKVSYIEQEELDVTQLKDCYRLLRRIGNVGRFDERHDRYQRLKDTCERLRRSAGL